MIAYNHKRVSAFRKTNVNVKSVVRLKPPHTMRELETSSMLKTALFEIGFGEGESGRLQPAMIFHGEQVQPCTCETVQHLRVLSYWLIYGSWLSQLMRGSLNGSIVGIQPRCLLL